MASQVRVGGAGVDRPHGDPEIGADVHQTLTFMGVNLLGDCLCTTPTVRTFRRKYPRALIVYLAQNAPHCRILDGNPDIDLVLYNEDLALHGDAIVCDAWLRRLPIDCRDAARLHRFDIAALHRQPNVFDDHICRGFARLLNVSVESVRPIVAISDAERALARTLARGRYIVMGMHATSHVVGRDGHLTPKDWVFERWLQVAKAMHADGFDIIAVGAEGDPQVPSRYFRNLYGLPVKVVAALLQAAACVVTVESGLSHLCHAVDAPMVLIYSKDVPLRWAEPHEATRCRVLYDYPPAISAEHVLRALESVLHSV